MSKTIWVVERTDNHGEFQPMAGFSFNIKEDADRSRDYFIRTSEKDDKKMKYRVMAYIRKISESGK